MHFLDLADITIISSRRDGCHSSEPGRADNTNHWSLSRLALGLSSNCRVHQSERLVTNLIQNDTGSLEGILLNQSLSLGIRLIPRLVKQAKSFSRHSGARSMRYTFGGSHPKTGRYWTFSVKLVTRNYAKKT